MSDLAHEYEFTDIDEVQDVYNDMRSIAPNKMSMQPNKPLLVLFMILYI